MVITLGRFVTLGSVPSRLALIQIPTTSHDDEPPANRLHVRDPLARLSALSRRFPAMPAQSTGLTRRFHVDLMRVGVMACR